MREGIISSNLYSSCTFAPENRDISRPLVNSLKASMLRNGFIKSKAISVKRVKKEFVVLDGQHRLVAAEELGIHFWYKIDNIKKEIIPDLQIAQKWLPKDYLKHYSVLGVPEYITLRTIHQAQPKVSLTTLVNMLTIKTDAGFAQRNNFSDGKLKINYLDETVRTLELVHQLYTHYPNKFLFHRTFLVAFMHIIEIEGYDHKRMLEKLKYQSEKFKQMITIKGYLEMFDSIYNYKSTDAKRIKFELK